MEFQDLIFVIIAILAAVLLFNVFMWLLPVIVVLLIAFFITFMGVIVGSYFLGKAIEGIIKMVKANALNKILGALMGMLKCLCVLSILLNFVLLVDYNHIIITPKVQQESKLFKPTYTLGNKLTASLKLQLQHLREKNNNESSKN